MAAVILINCKMCLSLHYFMLGIFWVYTRMLWGRRNSMEPFIIMSDYVHVTNLQNGHHFHQLWPNSSIISLPFAIEIWFYVVHSCVLPYQDLKGSISTDARPRKPSNIQNSIILTKHMQVPRFCAYSHVLAYMGKNIVLVYTCTALIIREINTCNVPTYEEFNVIIFYGHVTQNQDGRHFTRK